MRKLLLTITFTFIIFITGFTQSVGIGTTQPDSSALLDVKSINKGFLAPRISLTATNISSPVLNPATGLLVYNIDSSGISPNNVVPSYYYWTGKKWQILNKDGNALGDMLYWDGTNWIILPIGINGQVLTVCGGIPHWGGCPVTTTITSNNNPLEVSYRSNSPTTSLVGDSVLGIWAWTIATSQVNGRVAMQFDLSSIPSNVTIDSAKLYLYASPFPEFGDKVNSDYGSADACYIQRITAPWTASSISWNTPPVTTTVDEAVIPQSTTSFQNDVVDVTTLINDMKENGNYGFAIQLQNETYYNIRQYASSYYSNTLLHPQLVVSYH